MAAGTTFIIRKATVDDIAVIHDLIVELAVFERCGDAVKVTVDQLRRDGFSSPRRFDVLVAEQEGEVLAMALYYPRYSTWQGMCLYLEDLIVRGSARGLGIGTALLQALAREGLEMGAFRLQWQVLDWNEDAIRFYKRLGAEIDSEWLDCKLPISAMRELIKD